MATRILTTKEVAAQLRVSISKVIDLIRTGQLKAHRVGNVWRVEAEELDRYWQSISSK